MLYLGFYGVIGQLSFDSINSSRLPLLGMTHRFVWMDIGGYLIFSPSGNRVIRKMPEFDMLRELGEGVPCAIATWLFTKNKQCVESKSRSQGQVRGR